MMNDIKKMKRIRDKFPKQANNISTNLENILLELNSMKKDIEKGLSKDFAKNNFKGLENSIELAKDIVVYEEDIQVSIEKLGCNNFENIILEVNDDDSLTEYSLGDDFKEILPNCFEIDDSGMMYAETFAEVLVQTCELLFKLDEEKFKDVEYDETINIKNKKSFSNIPEKLRTGVKVGDNLYVETAQTENEIKDLIVRLLEMYDINIDEFKLYTIN